MSSQSKWNLKKHQDWNYIFVILGYVLEVPVKKKMKNKEIITDGEEIQKVYGSKENQKSKSQ